jgi:hypothetical protein
MFGRMSLLMGLLAVLVLVGRAEAAEVNKGEIPAEHLDKALKALPWGVQIWDIDEAKAAFKDKEATVLWIDTRPASFFDQGTMKDAQMFVYDQTGASYPDGEKILTKDALDAAVADANPTYIVFFCQGPKCHRSYNAAYKAVTDWGYDTDKIVWFRDGYPIWLQTIQNDPRMKRRAQRYLSDAAVNTL